MRDWERLGLAAPTTDLAEIKRAYARTLKTTRPDDDAAAYQALRESYERLAAGAQWQQSQVQALDAQEQDGHERDTVVVAPLPSSASSPAPDADAASDGFAPLDPAELLKWLELTATKGPEALRAAAPALREQLSHQPLEWRLDSSQLWAEQTAVHATGWPVEILQVLFEHFEWDRDLRAERELGADLALRLRWLAEERLDRPIEEPHLRQPSGDILRFSRLMNGLRPLWVRKALLMTALKPVLEFQLERMSPSLLRRAGWAAPSMSTQWQRLEWAAKVVSALVILLTVYLVYAALSLSWTEGLSKTYNGVNRSLAEAGYCVIATLVVWGIRRWGPWPWLAQRLPLRPDRWRWLLPCLGLGLLALAAVAAVLHAYTDQQPVVRVGLLVIAGLFLALPRSFTLSAVSLMLYSFLFPALHPLHNVISPILMLWIVAGAQAYELGWFRPGARLPEAPLWRSPPLGLSGWVLMGTVGLPTLVTWIADRAGYYPMLWVFLLALAPAYQRDGVTGPVQVTALMLALVAVLGLQRVAVHLARRQLQTLAA